MVDMTNISSIDSLQGLAYYTNSMTGEILFTGGVVVLYFVMIMVLLKNDTPFINGFTAASWSMFVLSGLLWFAELVPTIFVLGFLIASAFGTLFLYASPS